jgi:hypothetical protein
METKFYGDDIVEISGDTIFFENPDDIDDIFGIFFTTKCSAVLLKKENITGDFFNLSTGIAGEILQKFSNFKKRMAIIGNFDDVESKSLKDFIYESNKTGQILFVKTIEEALKIFRKQ